MLEIRDFYVRDCDKDFQNRQKNVFAKKAGNKSEEDTSAPVKCE